MSFEPLILAVRPEKLHRVQGLSVTPAIRAYRIGAGPHLFRAGGRSGGQGGLMVMDDRGFDGRGGAGSLCDEIVRECAARGFRGVVCDFPGEVCPALRQTAGQLGRRLEHRGAELYVPETLAGDAPGARVMISSALSGGSLSARLEEAAQRYGADKITLAAERRAEDFFLPSPEGAGRKLSREELTKMLEEREPSVFFSHELCARYFTYMDRASGAHFVLFDDGDTVRRKLRLARGLGIGRAILDFDQVEDILPQLAVRQERRV